jgi:hypothetical protein
MGQQVGGMALMMAGRLIGGAIGGPIGAMVGGLAGGIIGSLLFNRAQKPAVSDYQLANSSYGRPIPLIYGQWRMPGTVIWETKISSKGHSAGKGAMGGQQTYSYNQSAAFVFCQGPARLLKVWLDGKLFWDNTSLFPTELTKYKFVGRIYNGTEEQLPDPLIQAWDVGNVDPPLACPAYRGLAYIVIQDIDLSHYGGRMPNVTAAWSTDVTDRIIYQHLHLADWDPGDGYFSGLTEPLVAGNGTAVDWAAQRVYWLSSSGSLRVWDIQTGVTLMAKTWEQLWPGGGTPPAYMPANTHYPVAGIAMVPGGSLYIVTGSVFYSGSWQQPILIKLNPNTLLVDSTFPVPYNWPNNGPYDLHPFQLVSATGGAFDMIACQPIYGGTLMIIGCSGSGSTSGFMTGSVGGIFGRSYICVGKQDTVSGTAEVWSIQWAYGTDPWHVYIWKATITGNDPSAVAAMGAWEQMGTLTPASYGCSTPTTGYMSAVVAYDPSDDTLIISDGFVGFNDTPGSPSRSIKWSPRIGVIWTKAPAVMWSNTKAAYYDLAAGRVGDSNSGNYFSVADTATGASSTMTSSPSGGYNIGYDSGANAIAFRYLLGGGPGGAVASVAFLQRVTTNEIPVADILLDLCVRAGIDELDVDVSEVTATTIGYGVIEEKAYGSAIADLCHTYQIDMVESDYKLKFVPRGQPSVATILQDDLASIDNDQAHYWQGKRALEQEMPLQINLRFADPELDYQTGATYAKRIASPVATVYSKRVKSVDLPVVATNAEAHQIAEKWLYTMWAERDTYQTKLGQKYLWLDPTDSVDVSLDNGDTISVRIEKSDIEVDYSMKLDMASEDAETYNPSLARGAQVAQAPQTILQAPFVDLLQFNIPLLLDTDDLGGTVGRIYYAGGPTAAMDPSVTAQVYESTDGGSAWPQYSTITGFANWGYATNVLADTASAFATDYVNTLTVSLVAGSEAPASCTYVELMSGANAAIVGSEIIQFQTVTTNTDGSVTLSTLLRGRRGTEWATSTHTHSEIVVFIAVTEIIPGRLDLAQLNVGELWKLVPTGRFIDSTPAETYTYLGYDLKPYAPVNFARANSGSPPDLILTWKRRTRIGGLLLDGTDTAPLSEESEAYEAYVLPNAAALASFDPTVPATYTRAFTGLTSATVTYTATMMSSDAFTPATDTLYLVVYQISAVIGRGFRGYQALPPS